MECYVIIAGSDKFIYFWRLWAQLLRFYGKEPPIRLVCCVFESGLGYRLFWLRFCSFSETLQTCRDGCLSFIMIFQSLFEVTSLKYRREITLEQLKESNCHRLSWKLRRFFFTSNSEYFWPVFNHQNDKCHSSAVVISQSAITWNRSSLRTGAFGIDGPDKALSLRRTFKVCDIYRSDD